MSTWWSDRPLRIYHPNAREFEFGEIDADALVRDSLAASAEAVVVSAGGIYAFYPTRVRFHYVSPTTRGRNVIGEIVERAHGRDLKVIARLDFSRAREEVYAARPDWFERAAGGEPGRIGAMFATCPLGGYQNEEYAFGVFRELLEEQHVDGFHLNAHGFHGVCRCDRCAATFGAPIPAEGGTEAAARERFALWRHEAMAAHLRGYHDLVRSISPDAFLMGEHAGEEYPDWALTAAYDLPALRGAFSQLLASSGGMAAPRRSRWWVAMTADRIAGLGSRPIINNKLQMRDMRMTHAALPPVESEFQCWQAIAHGAGLKLVTFGVPRTLADARLMRSVAAVFGFMREHDRLLAGSAPVTPAALVSPERALLRAAAGDLRGSDVLRAEFRGLYDALTSLHVLFGAIPDSDLRADTLARFRLVVVPGLASLLDDRAVAALSDYVRAGGRVVATDVLVRDRSGDLVPIRPGLRALFDLEARGDGRTLYAVSTGAGPSSQLAGACLPVSGEFRKVTTRAQVDLTSAAAAESATPEEFATVQPGPDALVVRTAQGRGSAAYVAFSLGSMIWDLPHADLLSLLQGLVESQAAGDVVVRTNAPGCVGLTLASSRAGRVLHLVNSAGTAPLRDSIRLAPIEIELPAPVPRRATFFAPGARPVRLPVKTGRGGFSVVVPELSLYGLVAFEE